MPPKPAQVEHSQSRSFRPPILGCYPAQTVRAFVTPSTSGEDNVFFLRMTYLGKSKGEGDRFDDIGTWVLSADRATLILRGGREAPVMFAAKSAELIRKLDLEGKEIVSPAQLRPCAQGPLRMVRSSCSYAGYVPVHGRCRPLHRVRDREKASGGPGEGKMRFWRGPTSRLEFSRVSPCSQTSKVALPCVPRWKVPASSKCLWSNASLMCGRVRRAAQGFPLPALRTPIGNWCILGMNP